MALLGSTVRAETLATENPAIRLEFDSASAAGRLTDKRTGESWDLNPPAVAMKGQPAASVKPVSARLEGGIFRFSAGPRLSWEVKLLANAVVYSSQAADDIDEVLLLNRSLTLEAGAQNYYAVAHRLGNLLPVEGEQPITRRMRAYTRGGYSMAMHGVVKNGSALLVTWDPPYADVIVDYAVAPVRRMTSSIALRRGASGFCIQPLGRGGYVEIAKAYRPIARERGLLKLAALPSGSPALPISSPSPSSAACRTRASTRATRKPHRQLHVRRVRRPGRTPP